MPKQTFYNLTEEKQEQIINAAISEFANFTFNEVKISDIINKAKIPRSSFYDYFLDKEDLYKYIIFIIKEEKMRFMAPVLEIQEDKFFERLKGIFEAGAKFAALRPEYERLAQKMYENIEVIKKIFKEGETDVSSFYESMLIDGIKSGEIRRDIDVKFVAKSIYILSSQLMMEAYEEKQEDLSRCIEEITNKMIDFIKVGISR
ncbi:TetR/AcrR family transcriptional regulator [Cellulosilyticum sp. I15G10I2]|uniref:TetR/AcrR family transcriptional regulator n=1 Tax=Cellulosilyticum sp. I15G10I2 TaxID=1892843 RepID=UPI00085C3383|nr:TetR/AcrR family transcriptional regulator [Cellulosilyticum sp. I15G10I2]